MKKQPAYATEAALCADFIRWAKSEAGTIMFGVKTPVWTPYAETAGWDILLVAEDGTQIGIQAKLKFNMKVLHQCLPGCWDDWRDTGPDYRAVLVPDRDVAYSDICAALGLMLFTPTRIGWGDAGFAPGLDFQHGNGGWHYWSPRKRHNLPEYVPDVVAGASGPVQLTTWKIAALRIAATLEVRGFVTKKDFGEYRIDSRRWTGPGGWLVPKSERMQDAGRFVRGPALDFDRQHPTVYATVLAEIREKLAGEVIAPTPSVPDQLILGGGL